MTTALARALEELQVAFEQYTQTHYPQDPTLAAFNKIIKNSCEACYLQLSYELDSSNASNDADGVDDTDAELEKALVALADRFGEDILLDYILMRLSLMSESLKRIFEGVKTLN